MRAAAATLRLVPRAAGLVPRAALSLPPRLRRRLGLLLALLAITAGGYLGWFRDSSFVAVEQVTITGVTTSDAERVEAALRSAARDMTTLNVRVDELERAVSAYPAIRSVDAVPDFPHGLSIRVIQHRPVALLSIEAGRRVPVAADGTVLRGVPAGRDLPVLSAQDAVRGDRLAAGEAHRLVAVAAAAPAPLLGRLARIRETRARGIVVLLRDGPDLVLGDAARLPAKWAAAARVLADSEAAGASYVDVRVPARPVAGGLAVGTLAPVGAAGAADAPPAGATPPAPGSPPAGQPPPTALEAPATEQAAPGAEAPAAQQPPPAGAQPEPEG